MYCQLFHDVLTEYTYAAELAGLAYNIHNTTYGLIVSWCFILYRQVIIIIVIVIVVVIWKCWTWRDNDECRQVVCELIDDY